MEFMFVQLAKWCNIHGAIYNLCYGNNVYEFSVRLMDCGSISGEDLTEMLDLFNHNRQDGWCVSVRFDKDCIRLTYAKFSLS